MTRTEIYNQLVTEWKMRYAFQVSPNSPENFLEIAKRKANQKAVRDTWYWFNNQEKFKKFCMYPIKTNYLEGKKVLQ